MSSSATNGKNSAQAGFTLVEIAIVLVIIGLLLGGILKGQEMITQAKIKNIVNDFNGVTVAVTSYQDRYRAIPGDDRNASTRWTVQAPASGNGDGVMAGKYSATVAGPGGPAATEGTQRSEEHTSEHQSPLHLVCRLLLVKKKKKTNEI